MKFSPSVLLIDTAFLNRAIADLNQLFSQKLQRDLDLIHPSLLLTYLALDAKFPRGDNNSVQVLFLHDEMSAQLPHSSPCNLECQLSDNAFRSVVGEVSIHAFQPEGMSSLDEFLHESLRLVAAAEEVERIGVVADTLDPAEAQALYAALSACPAEKEITLFDMSPSAEALPAGIRHAILGYPVMKALGIRGDEV